MRDFMKLEALNDNQLVVMALLMHDIYKSFDLVLRLLLEHDRRHKTQLATKYVA